MVAFCLFVCFPPVLLWDSAQAPFPQEAVPAYILNKEHLLGFPFSHTERSIVILLLISFCSDAVFHKA